MTGKYAIEYVAGFYNKGGNSIISFAPPVHVSFYALALSSQGAISNKTGEFGRTSNWFFSEWWSKSKG